MGISGDVLPDANAPMVFDALRDAGIPVNQSIDPRGSHARDVGPEYGTIFHQWQLDRQLMDRLYNAGFVDVDTFNSAGYTPLMINPFYVTADALLQRAGWLVSKGAEMTKCVPGTSISAIHLRTFRVIRNTRDGRDSDTARDIYRFGPYTHVLQEGVYATSKPMFVEAI
ncbi:uncharacterized protein NFIA_088010 [Aspergillus fischeri NRRL 181]|uniref:Uncharacterized protein n=1 Tax=Neosartorya fischeri (strain ATCC 1020 / DSM 3700 / CBS 544.65 / FGSC A1164 / JCM 1740 / NRRL 181 / WB 181) TaxID=331117 RepID=A1DHI8_NEOFI|nr:uncharacterized protein NFIA_088010 [Aspergillus fischeri NRRL 181]EAW18845.1 hypothetical protein NFIA_088010 [Aspergillus fischeri NRRL 181]KAG2012355.1 hypothetical protein GB937_007184 [Aspergillus fischeri]